jgi:Na+-transporting methylmalonyl-CoA/oxaloacetate decarboxylase gamma subunit
MKTKTIAYLMLFLIALILIIPMTGCGSKKEQKNKYKEETKIEETKKNLETVKENSNLEKTEQIKTDIKTGTVTKKRVIRPIDPTKPASVTNEKGEKKIIENAEILEEESQINNQILSDKKSTLEQQKETLIEKEKAETKKGSQKIDQQMLKLERSFPVKWSFIGIGVLVIGFVVFKNRFNIIKYLKSVWWF